MIGTYFNTKRGLVLIPDDEKLKNKTIKVMQSTKFFPIDGMKVVCDIVSYSKPMVVQVVKEIGYKDDPGVDILSVLLDHDIQAEFPEEVMQQVHEISQVVLEEEKRQN